MKLTRPHLRKLIREEMQKENIQTWFTEQPAGVLDQVAAALEPMTGPLTHNKPLMNILQKAEEADLAALLDKLQNPYGKGAKVTKISSLEEEEEVELSEGWFDKAKGWLEAEQERERQSADDYQTKRSARKEKESEKRKEKGKKNFPGSGFGSGLEKALREEEEEEMSEAKRARPAEFNSGDKVTHEEYGTGTVTHPGASTDATGGREVSVKWDDPDIGSRRAIEANLKKK